jgi:hypothetical protein
MLLRHLSFFLTVCFYAHVCFAADPVRSQESSATYLREMPSADRVLADMQGSDSPDTAARQWGAHHRLHRNHGLKDYSRMI